MDMLSDDRYGGLVERREKIDGGMDVAEANGQIREIDALMDEIERTITEMGWMAYR